MNDRSKYHDWLPAWWCMLISPPETNSSSSGMLCTCRVAPRVASPKSVTSQYSSGTVRRYRQVTWQEDFSPVLTGFRTTGGRALLGTRFRLSWSTVSTMDERFSSEKV